MTCPAIVPVNVTTPSLDLAYEIDGENDGIPVILVHGFPDSVRTWDAVIKDLASTRARFIRPYVRGVGTTRVRDKRAAAMELHPFDHCAARMQGNIEPNGSVLVA